jgi:hypothetical protein
MQDKQVTSLNKFKCSLNTGLQWVGVHEFKDIRASSIMMMQFKNSAIMMMQFKNSGYTRKYIHAETLALLTKPLYFPNMKYLK